MKFSITGLALLSLFVLSCGEPEQQQVKKDEKDTTKAYLPVTDYIRGEIKTIDSLPVGILKRVTKGNKADSAFIQPAEFRLLAAEFLSNELEKGQFEQSFTESSFFDQSTELLTFTYEGTNPAVTVKRVDVLISPSLQLDKIKSIYMEKAYKSGDTSISKKMYWKAGASFQVATEKKMAQQSRLEQIKVIWDPRDY
jgi:hypothetical protein